jgi:FixJ family two-component response regulator
MAKTFPVYVVDDDPNIRDWAESLCVEFGLSYRGFSSGEEFLAAAGGLGPGCVLLDMRMPRRTGLQVQAELAGQRPDLPVVAMSGYGDVEVAVQSMKMGAVEFLEKPFSPEALGEALTQAFTRIDGAAATLGEG